MNDGRPVLTMITACRFIRATLLPQARVAKIDLNSPIKFSLSPTASASY